MNCCEKALTLFKPNDKYAEAIGIDPDGNKIKFRLFKTSDNIVGYFRKGSRKRGYRLENQNLLDILPITHYKQNDKKWQDGWKKVRARLEASGLWKNLISEINIALDIGYDKMQDLYKKYWDIQDEAEKLAYIKQVDTRLIDTNDEGKEYIKSSIIWSYAKLPKVKKMYFGKYKTPHILEQIQKAMESKTKTSQYGRASYDISFEYNPEKNKAYYSEEYKGCGNGHYFLALDATHCLFYEDD